MRQARGIVLSLNIFNAFLTPFSIHLCRSRREAELNDLQRCVEEETRRHEVQLSELRVKHSTAIDNLQEQLDNSKRVREGHFQKIFMCKHTEWLITLHHRCSFFRLVSR